MARAWHPGNSEGYKTHKVGEKKPNPWGLYDVYANVWEWCWDWRNQYEAKSVRDPVGGSAGAIRVLRGGSFGERPVFLRPAYRGGLQPGLRFDNAGFRLARTYN